MIQEIKIYSDGGARGNPGPSASSFVAFKNNKILFKEYKYFGIKTNNQAEYIALLMAYKWLERNNIHKYKISFYLDSELVVKQMQGVFKIKNSQLRILFNKIKFYENRRRKHFNDISYTLIGREFNCIADKLVNKSIDENL